MADFSPKLKRKLPENGENEKINSPGLDIKLSKRIKKNNEDSPVVSKQINTEDCNTPTNKSLKNEKSKTPLNTIQNNMKQTKLSFLKAPKESGDWNIQDFLYEKQWKELLTDEFALPYFKEINDKIKPGYKKDIVRPPKELVFNALNSTKLNDIKVVIIGQDPYHDDDQAHGLAFSVPRGIKIPPSLRNIFIELKNDIPCFEKDEKLGGCLQKWTKEGVFLLNTFLTVEAHKAGSHSKIGWDKFTDKVISLISEKNDGCAFLLWGAFAQKKEVLIDKKRHKVLKCAHPSPFSVTKFFNSKCFSGANEFLKSINKSEVNWSFK